MTRADHLALVAEADARGRVCADQNGLLDNIVLSSSTAVSKAVSTRRILSIRSTLASSTSAAPAEIPPTSPTTTREAASLCSLAFPELVRTVGFRTAIGLSRGIPGPNPN